LIKSVECSVGKWFGGRCCFGLWGFGYGVGYGGVMQRVAGVVPLLEVVDVLRSVRFLFGGGLPVLCWLVHKSPKVSLIPGLRPHQTADVPRTTARY
jgi:hypothetical protein